MIRNKLIVFAISILILITAALTLAALSKPADEEELPDPVMQSVTNSEVAILAGGCFWGVEAYFERVEGVIDVKSGYTGGTLDNPSYKDVSYKNTGHAEAVWVEFDPEVIGYRDILRHFFRAHDPTQLNRQGNDIGTQYRSAVFYNSESQKKIAEELIAEMEESGDYDSEIVTEVVEASEFYDAEEYHQDYLTKNPWGYCHVDLGLAEEPLD